jgi:hypothetical protein
MPHPYKWLLMVILLLVPFAVIAYRNKFDRSIVTLVRFFAAVAAAWLLTVGTCAVVHYVDVRLATTQAELDSIYNGDGARYASTLLFGWAPGVVIATISWAVARSWRWVMQRRRFTS